MVEQSNPAESTLPPLEQAQVDVDMTVPDEPKGESISHLVNSDHVQQIIEMGFTKVVAEKALFLTQAGVEKAMEWIEQNMDAEDFQEELLMVGQQKPVSKLTPEEAAAKAKELQIQVRARIAERDKKRAIENEAARKKLEKELAIAKQINDERQHKLAIEAKMKEKKDLEARVQEQRRRYELDMKERFGDQWQSKVPQKEEAKEKSGKELAETGIATIATLYTEFRAPGVAQTCFKTLSTLLGNLLKDPSNEKFRKVNLDNEAIKKRVATINGGLSVLKGAGFTKAEDGNYLQVDTIDAKLVQEIVGMVQSKIV